MSALVKGTYGIRDVAISVPTVVGRAGVLQQIELEVWPKELNGLQSSAHALKETLGKVQG